MAIYNATTLIVVLLVFLSLFWGVHVQRSISAFLSSLMSSSLYFSQDVLVANSRPSERISDPTVLDAVRLTKKENPTSSPYHPHHPHHPHHHDYTWSDRGCQEWPKPPPISDGGIANNDNTRLLSRRPPTGIVVTLAKRRGTAQAGALGLLCGKIPTQQAAFLEPQGMDLLLLLDMDDGAEMSITSRVAACLELVDLNVAQSWNNLDGSVLTTHAFTSKTGRRKVYLAPYEMPYPNYIQRNMTILEEPMLDCESPQDYIQGTRYYSDPFLHLKILENYEYMIKMDLDVEFKAAVPFNIMWDMKQRGALFGHTGQFLEAFPTCSEGIHPVMKSFVEEHANKTTSASWTQHWKGPCSAGVRVFERGHDLYFTNLVVLTRAFFQSEPVRAYGRWMNEYNPGYFKYRWGDQLFFHVAMGMFLGPE
jgi:hypothetical protein